MKNQIFVPTVAEFSDDIHTSLELQEPLVGAGYTPGLMLVIRNGRKGVTLDSVVQKQKSNLERVTDYNGPIITMLSNIPIEEIDFLHNPEYATEHVKRGIDFTRTLLMGDRRIVTFHLNSLVTAEEFCRKDRAEWMEDFKWIVQPALQDVARYAKTNGVEVKVETVPVPEFGDIPSDDERSYRGVKWNELRNPFYLTAHWGFKQVRDAGLGICLDLCHSKTIYDIARLGDHDNVLHREDRDALSERQLFEDVRAIREGDIAHVNDGAGTFSTQHQTVHKEDLALGAGEIVDLPDIIRYMDQNKIAYVLEIGETDFKNRPNMKQSVDYVLSNCA